MRDAAFTAEPFTVHTRWIETEWAGGVPPFTRHAAAPAAPAERETVVVEVGGKRLEVSLPNNLLLRYGSAAAARPGASLGRRARSRPRRAAARPR